MRFRHQINLLVVLITMATHCAQGAGVTVITHGYSPWSGEAEWIRVMSDAIATRAGGSVTYYDAVIGMGVSTGKPAVGFFTQHGAPVFSGDSEVVIRVFWDQVGGGFPETQADTTDIAKALEPFITQAAGLAHPLAELPIHLIGHSRGASVMSELGRILGQKGIWTHQLTLLDPHPVRNFDLPSGNDAEIRVWETILFADNYYEDFLGTIPDGEAVEGANNEHLTHLPGGYGDATPVWANHLDVFLWYQGTVNKAVGASDGTQIITDTMRNTWYQSYEYGGEKAGFYYSRLGGGQWALDGLLYGYNDGNHNILPDSRVSLTRTGAEWPSLVSLTFETTGTVEAGTSFPLHYIFQSYDSDSTITMYLDSDQNPYNGNEISLGLSENQNPQSATARLTRMVDVNGSVPISATPGIYYVYGKISNPIGSRYLYALGKVRVVGAAAPTFVVNASSGPNGSISPHGTFTRSAGASVTLNATANSGFEVAYWYSNGLVDQTGGASYTIPNLQQSTSVQVTFRSTTGTVITGDLLVNLTPQAAVSAGAQWRFVGGNFQTPNVPFQFLGPGQYQISFKALNGYTTPPDQTVNIIAGETASVTANYAAISANTFTLTLNQGGVQGSIANQPFGSGSGNVYSADAVVQLRATANSGYHFVSWGGDVSGTENPRLIVMDGNKSVRANFELGDPTLGTLTVTIQPSAAATAGVTWGFSANDFRISGSSYTTFPQSYILTLHPVEGWLGPSSVIATLAAGQTTNVTVTFTPDATPGLLTVTLSPWDVTAAAKWHVNGGTGHSSGATIALPFGSGYNITFDPVSGWASPSSQTVEISKGQTTIVSGNYTTAAGQPVIISIIPPIGPLTGGTPLTIDGINFRPPATVLIGGKPAMNVIVSSASRITCFTPSNSVYGSVPVIVQTSGGSATNLNGFTYGVSRGTNIEFVTSIGGRIDAVAVRGNYAYVGEGSSLIVLDVSNPDSPSPVGRVALPGLAGDIALFTQSGRTFACVAGRDSGLHIVDVTAPSQPALIGFYKTPGICFGVTVIGGLAYVADGSGGLEIFDLSIPSAPVLVSAVPQAGFANEIALKATSNGVFAYLSTAGGLQIVEVSDPQAPVVRGYVGFGVRTLNVVVTADRAYLPTQSYTQIADISNPDNPTSLGQFGGLGNSIAIQGTTLYEAGFVGFRTYDISSATPLEIGYISAPAPFADGFNMATANDFAYIAGGEAGFHVVSVVTPAAPARRGSYSSTAGVYMSLALIGSDAFLLTENSGLKRFDISNQINPTMRSQFDPASGGGAKVRLSGNRVFLLGYDGQFRILDATNPNQTPVLLGTTSQSQFYAQDFYLLGNTIVASGFDTTSSPYKPAVVIFDTSNPASINIQNPFNFPTLNGGAYAIAGNGSIACAAVPLGSGNHFSLEVINVSNPTSLQQIGQLSDIGVVRTLRLAPDNRYLFVGCQYQDLSWKIVDLADNGVPVLVSSNYVGAGVLGIEFSGANVYLATERGVLVYDVSNPSSPRLVRSYLTPSIAFDVKVSGDSLFVADGGGGFTVLKLADIESPSVLITNPTSLPVRTNINATINLGGVASDNVGLTRITWTNDRGGGGEVALGNSWTIDGIALQPGTNILTVTASDAAGNNSSDALAVIYQTPKQNQTITFPVVSDKTFGDAPVTLLAAASSGLPVSFSLVSGSATVSNNVLRLIAAGNVTIRATQPGDENFNSATPTNQTFNVAKADQGIIFATLPNKSVGDVPFAMNATASSGLPVTFSILSGPAIIASNVITLTNAGVATVRASQSGNTNFNAALDVDRSFVIGKFPQFITFGALGRQAFGDAPFALSASASSGLPVNFSILSGPAILNGSILSMTGAGLVVLRASQPGDETYSPAPSVDQALSVAPGNNVITDFQQLANGMFTFRFYGEVGTNYVVQTSTNLMDWMPLTTNQIGGLGYFEFTDLGATNYDRRFYQIAP